MSELKRYKPDLTNTATPWPNLKVKMLEASMVESESGGYVRFDDLNKFAIEQQIRALNWIVDYSQGCSASIDTVKQRIDKLRQQLKEQE